LGRTLYLQDKYLQIRVDKLSFLLADAHTVTQGKLHTVHDIKA